jgi:hypothetical protein
VASWKKKHEINPHQSKERRVQRQPKRAQQIAKLRLFVWDMMRLTYTQRLMGMASRYWMKHIA